MYFVFRNLSLFYNVPKQVFYFQVNYLHYFQIKLAPLKYQLYQMKKKKLMIKKCRFS